MILALLFKCSALAEPSASEAIALRADFGMQVGISGAYAGFGYANAELKAQGRDELFCSPRRMVMAKEQLFELMDDQIRNVPGLAKVPAYAVMLNALMETFPCSKVQ